MPLVPNKELTRRFAPEEEELARKRDELERLQSALVDRELKLADLRAELSAFEGLYLRRVGVLYSELDEWNARLAELIAEEEGTEAAQTAATQARAQATESDAAAHGEAAQAEEVTRSPELKSLFREVAKRIELEIGALIDSDIAKLKAKAEGAGRHSRL